MTDNQFNQLFELVTKTVNGIQRLEKEQTEIKTDIVEMKGNIVEMKGDIVEMKSDISELKQGQARIEKQVTFKNKSLNVLQGDILSVRTRVEMLEQEAELSN